MPTNSSRWILVSIGRYSSKPIPSTRLGNLAFNWSKIVWVEWDPSGWLKRMMSSSSNWLNELSVWVNAARFVTFSSRSQKRRCFKLRRIDWPNVSKNAWKRGALMKFRVNFSLINRFFTPMHPLRRPEKNRLFTLRLSILCCQTLETALDLITSSRPRWFRIRTNGSSGRSSIFTFGSVDFKCGSAVFDWSSIRFDFGSILTRLSAGERNRQDPIFSLFNDGKSNKFASEPSGLV